MELLNESSTSKQKTVSDYLPVFNLVTHLTDMAKEDVFQYGQVLTVLQMIKMGHKVTVTLMILTLTAM